MIKFQPFSILMPCAFIHHGKQLQDIFDDIHLLSGVTDLQ